MQWAGPSVRPSCVVTPRHARWFMDGRPAPLSRPRKGWDSKTYPLTLSRHESEKAPLGLSRPWRGGLGGVCDTPLPCRKEEESALRLSRPRKGWDSKMYLLTLSRHESERVSLGLSRPRKGWDSKMYPLILSRHESERTNFWLSYPWRGELGGVCDTPLPCRKDEGSALGPSRSRKEWDSKMYPQILSRHESERATLGLSYPWRGGLGGVCDTPLPCRKEQGSALGLSCPWRGGRGADVFATCLYSFLVTITPRLTFHF